MPMRMPAGLHPCGGLLVHHLVAAVEFEAEFFVPSLVELNGDIIVDLAIAPAQDVFERRYFFDWSGSDFLLKPVLDDGIR